MTNKKLLYVGLVEDHSGSMCGLKNQAIEDTQHIIQSYKDSEDENLSVLLTVEECTSYNPKSRELFTPIQFAQIPTDYRTGGSTPLNDSISKIISSFKLLPDTIKTNKDVSFLIMVFTDGEENCSSPGSLAKLTNEIKNGLEGKLTVVMRGPNTYGFRDYARQIGVQEGNMHLWDGVTKESFTSSTLLTRSAINTYTESVKMGAVTTDKFYTNLANVSVNNIKQHAKDISSEVKILTATQDEIIQDWVTRVEGSYTKGTVFYELTKSERDVQGYKVILIRDRVTGKVFGGRDARAILGLPTNGNSCKVAPGDHGHYDVFIQSTSINRKIPSGNSVVIWDSSKTTVPSFSFNTTPTFSNTKSDADVYNAGYKAGTSRRAKDKTIMSDKSKAVVYEQGYRDARNKSPRKY